MKYRNWWLMIPAVIAAIGGVIAISTDRPLALSDIKYKKYGNLYFIGTDEEPKVNADDVKTINELFEECSMVRIVAFHDEDILEFQMESRLTGGKYIVFTKHGKESPDEYMHVVDWLSDTWYIGES
jgi:hypothetical protein